MSVLSGTIYDYVCMILPPLTGNYLEIGVFHGTGFARIARENSNRQCYAVDPFIEDGHTVATSGVSAGAILNSQKESYLSETKSLTNTKLFEIPSSKFFEQLTDSMCDEMNVRIVTIDGDHHYHNVIIDFDIAIKLIGSKSGQIVVDDTDVVDVSRAYTEFTKKYANRIDREVDASSTTKVILIKESND